MANTPYLQGSYSAGEFTTESQYSQNLLEFPEISRSFRMQRPNESIAYFADYFGKKVTKRTVANKRVQWWLEGKRNRPAICTGTNTGDGVGNSVFTVEFTQRLFNIGDVITFKSQARAIVVGEPVSSAGGFTYDLKLQTSSATETITLSTDAAAGQTAGAAGNAFPEGSDQGYQVNVYPDGYDNYTKITRTRAEITGSAATTKTWLDGNKTYWDYQGSILCADRHAKAREWGYLLDKRTYDVNGNLVVSNNAGQGLPCGDGVIAQVATNNLDSYVTFSDTFLDDYIARLQYNAGMSQSHHVIYTGTEGARDFQRAMKNRYVDSGSLTYQAEFGNNKLGGNFNAYQTMDGLVMVVRHPLFDDPTVGGTSASGFPVRSGDMLFTNYGTTKNGENNIEICTKGNDGVDRDLQIGYLPGMVNMKDKQSSYIATASDKFVVEYLSEDCINVLNPQSCGYVTKVQS